MKNNRVKKVNPKEIFNPTLFWDAEDIDVKKHAGYIIARVLDFGNEKDIKVLRQLYSDKEIIKTIKRRRGLLPKTGKFWAVYFHLPLRNIACLRTYYQRTRPSK